MTLGSGIFLSTVVVALVFLYRSTQDRWNWRLIIRRMFFSIVAVVLVIGLITAIFYGYKNIASAPTRQTGYADLKLGMTMGEVQYVKGPPTDVVSLPGLEVIPVKFLNSDKRIEKYTAWMYDKPQGEDYRIDVSFDPKTKRLKYIACFSQGSFNCPSLFGIDDGTSEKRLLETLGDPSKQSLDGVTKTMSYDKLHTRFLLSRQKVFMLTVYQ